MIDEEKTALEPIVDWIREHHPGAPNAMSKETVKAIAQKACAERWHPEQVVEAFDILAGAVAKLDDDAA